MLQGSIDVQSEVGKGTEVTVRLPLSRLPGSDTPVNTPGTGDSTDGSSQDNSIRVIHAEYQATTVTLYSFVQKDGQDGMTEAGRTLKICVEDWFGLSTSLSLAGLTSKDLIMVDEKHLAECAEQNSRNLPTVVLCTNSTRSQAVLRQTSPAITVFVSKPFGPHKLAKAVRCCLAKARDSNHGLMPPIKFSEEDPGSLGSEEGTIIPDLEHLTIETTDRMRPLSVQTNGVITASESHNAQMAIEHWSAKDGSTSGTTSGDVTVTDGHSFPFPDHDIIEDGFPTDYKQKGGPPKRPLGDLTRRESRRPPLISRMTEPVTRTSFSDFAFSTNTSTVVTKFGEIATFDTNPPSSDAAKMHSLSGTNNTRLTASDMALHKGDTPMQPRRERSLDREKRPPKLLLVDDNKINLRLLETYMRKRKYTFVDSAENGQLAVQAAETHKQGYDIIFMGKFLGCSDLCLDSNTSLQISACLS